ncbi:dihydroxyacetone kinase [Mycoplasmopsis felis]|uniref:PTS-dependent dihydroxyacetone kinase phosphotransferase subunit DhaM n=1 Tax=Mycoplasmopsis felis TaxID=33923 RepID=UPI002AFE9A60|nr:dihydroxyacetone kinase [Mycoplasmopsis felis]WQQ05979.1 dihydroxyacetone kinase [Mycoplasmopsis felis]
MQKLFIIISHYEKLAHTIKDYFQKMLPINNEYIILQSIGGINGASELGTDPIALMDLINSYEEIKEVIIFSDLGSATLSAESVCSMITDKEIFVSKGALIENGFSAYVLANSGADFKDVINASQEPIIK